jgi:hypothetical protein
MPKKLKRTERGFAIYDEFKDQYGKKIRIMKSSLATDRCVWIQNEVCEIHGHHIGNAHLTVPMAKKVIAALQRFVDGVE